MSKAYFIHKNFDWSTMVNLLCFSVKNPSTLTKTQKVTRLYRAVMRQNMAENIHNSSASMDYFLEEQFKVRKDFDTLRSMTQSNPLWEETFEKYVRFIDDNYDPTMFIDDSRAYAPTAGRYVIYTEESLQFDPFGYYKDRRVSQNTPHPSMPYQMDFPHTDSQWIYNEQYSPEEQKSDQEKL